MRENYVYSKRIAGTENEKEQNSLSADTDPAQFPPYNLRAWLSKEIPHEVEEEKLLEVF